MRLLDIPLNDLDRLQHSLFDQNYVTIKSRGGAADGVVIAAVNEGVGPGFMKVETKGREPFVLYNVFVAKIRRESAGMVETTQQRRVAWCEMAQAFIDEYGDANVPADIKKCLAEVRARWID